MKKMKIKKYIQILSRNETPEFCNIQEPSSYYDLKFKNNTITFGTHEPFGKVPVKYVIHFSNSDILKLMTWLVGQEEHKRREQVHEKKHQSQSCTNPKHSDYRDSDGSNCDHKDCYRIDTEEKQLIQDKENVDVYKDDLKAEENQKIVDEIKQQHKIICERIEYESSRGDTRDKFHGAINQLHDKKKILENIIKIATNKDL